MATDISKAEDTSMSMVNGRWTRTRQKIMHAANLEELYRSNLIPMYGSRHPDNTMFRLTDATLEIIGNSNREIDVMWQGTYSSDAATFDNFDIEPWELDAQNLTRNNFSVTSPLLNIYNAKGKPVPLLNGAGNRLEAQHEQYGAEYSFIYCIKAKNGGPNIAQQPMINNETETVAGIKFEKHSGLLLPMTARMITDYDDFGVQKRAYWEVSVKIRRHPKSWMEEFLNVGTMAIFKSGEAASPIYRFTPWKYNATPAEKLETKPLFGSLQQVIGAKTTYAGDPKKDKDFAQKWQELPYEEMTEPMPLTERGGLYLEALLVPGTPYKKITGMKTPPGRWGQFNMPKKVEI